MTSINKNMKSRHRHTAEPYGTSLKDFVRGLNDLVAAKSFFAGKKNARRGPK
jgi:hypothetical protein